MGIRDQLHDPPPPPLAQDVLVFLSCGVNYVNIISLICALICICWLFTNVNMELNISSGLCCVFLLGSIYVTYCSCILCWKYLVYGKSSRLETTSIRIIMVSLWCSRNAGWICAFCIYIMFVIFSFWHTLYITCIYSYMPIHVHTYHTSRY